MNGICGLANLGNTCYINATLQILSHFYELNETLARQKTLCSVPDSVLVLEWVQLNQMIQSNHCSIMPGRFVDQMKQVAKVKGRNEFASMQQNDSVDYLEFMLDCFHVSMNKIEPVTIDSMCKEVKEYMDGQSLTIVSKLFMTCTLNRYLNPLTKSREFYKIEHEHRIGLPVPDLPKVTLQDCLAECFKQEMLEGENAWYDEKEDRKKPVCKVSALCHCPPILVLHLIRWRENMTKKETWVETPLTLDLTPYTIYKESTTYELFGILNHHGNMGGGHYYAHVKKDTWYSIDDGFIQPIQESAVIHPDNYCLFYRKL